MVQVVMFDFCSCDPRFPFNHFIYLLHLHKLNLSKLFDKLNKIKNNNNNKKTISIRLLKKNYPKK